jgi:hypothetical protein
LSKKLQCDEDLLDHKATWSYWSIIGKSKQLLTAIHKTQNWCCCSSMHFQSIQRSLRWRWSIASSNTFSERGRKVWYLNQTCWNHCGFTQMWYMEQTDSQGWPFNCQVKKRISSSLDVPCYVHLAFKRKWYSWPQSWST